MRPRDGCAAVARSLPGRESAGEPQWWVNWLKRWDLLYFVIRESGSQAIKANKCHARSLATTYFAKCSASVWEPVASSQCLFRVSLRIRQPQIEIRTETRGNGVNRRMYAARRMFAIQIAF